MKLLTNYYKNGYDFMLVKRLGNLAIAKGTSRLHQGDNWEVIEVQSHNGVQMGDNWVAACEFPPSNNQWGAKGWTATSESHAEEILLREAQKEQLKNVLR